MLYISSSLTPKESDYLEYVSTFFNIPISFCLPKTPFFLIWENKAIALKIHGYKTPILVNFESNKLTHRTRHNRGELILKAVNLKKYHHIWDVTAGLGKDSFLLASFGAQVTLFERHPLIAALLWDGLQRAQKNEALIDIINRMCFIYGSILNLNDKIILPKIPEVVYLDPMFPQRKKSARVKKEMIFLQTVVGEDLDYIELFNKVWKLNIPRIVVKRSKLAPNINTIKTNFTITGQTTRFDVYL